MIIKASACSWGKGLAAHLLKDDNEHVLVHELRGFVSDTLDGAFREAKAVSLGTKCKNYLFSASFNPPEDANCKPEDFTRAIDKLEQRLGLNGQPRAIVFHEKNNRTHAHCVWSRTDVASMTTPELPFYKARCRDVARELFLEHGWKMPEGLVDRAKRDPLNFNLAEWQAAQRIGEDPRWLKAIVQECWNNSDNKKGFEAALGEKSLTLARGDKRGFVLVDFGGGVHSLTRVLGLKTKEISTRLGDAASARSVEDAKQQIASKITPSVRANITESRQRFSKRAAALKAFGVEMTYLHRNERAKLAGAQRTQWNDATVARQARLPRGLRGLWSWVTGEYARIKSNNEMEARAQGARNAREREEIAARQREERRVLQAKITALRKAQAIELLALRSALAPYLKQSRAPAIRQDVPSARLGLKLER